MPADDTSRELLRAWPHERPPDTRAAAARYRFRGQVRVYVAHRGSLRRAVFASSSIIYILMPGRYYAVEFPAGDIDA